MNPRRKWDAQEVENFYTEIILPEVGEWIFPSYKFLFNKWYLGFYSALSYGKIDKYPTIDSFCKAFNLERDTKKRLKWTPEYIEEFYNTKVLPFVVDWKIPLTSWFLEKGGEYWGFITTINAWKIKGYKSMKDFRQKKGLKSKRIARWNKDDVEKFYKETLSKEIENNTLPKRVWFKRKWNEYSSFLSAIDSKRVGYANLSDFAKKKKLKMSRSQLWDKESADAMYYENIVPLMEDGKFLTYTRITYLWGRYLEWYDALRNKRVPWYDGIKDFKKKNNIK